MRPHTVLLVGAGGLESMSLARAIATGAVELRFESTANLTPEQAGLAVQEIQSLAAEIEKAADFVAPEKEREPWRRGRPLRKNS